VALCLGTLTSAHASYIDAGSASYLFQLALAGAFGALYTWRKVGWDIIKKFFPRRTDTRATDGNASAKEKATL